MVINISFFDINNNTSMVRFKLPDYMSRITRLVQTEGSEMSEILQNAHIC